MDPFLVDAEKPVDIPCDVDSVRIINVSDENIHCINIPQNITEIDLEGHITSYVIPSHIETFWGWSLGMNEIYVPDSVKQLWVDDNDLESIELPSNIVIVCLSNNKLKNITSRGPLTNIYHLDIRHNCMAQLDIDLPNTMREFYVEGNPDIRIKDTPSKRYNRIY